MKSSVLAAMAAFVTLSTTGHAFKADIHKELTKRAKHVYRDCAAKAGVATASDDLLNHLAKGTWAEDETQLVRRTRNWHYLRQNGMPARVWQPPFPYMSNPSLDRILDYRIRELASSAEIVDIFVAAGRVTHFLQDMRVPAHVLAAHHGSVLGTDGFDKFPMPDFRVTFSEPECKALAASAGLVAATVVRQRLCDAARETNQRIRTTIKGSQCTWLGVFWCAPGETADCGEPPYPGFGRYRGEPDRFGNPVEFKCNNEIHAIEKADYESFAEPGYQGLIRDTVFMMFFAQSRAAGKAMTYEERSNTETACPNY